MLRILGMVLAILALAGCGEDITGLNEFRAEKSGAGMTADSPAEEGAAVQNHERKIVYKAAIDLVVSEFSVAEKSISALVERDGGYVADFREDRRYGGRLGGNWIVRLPADRFHQFVDDLQELGIPTSREILAEDVTEQFIDLSARLKNQKALEARIIKLLDERAGDIKDVLEVESQLGRVREDVERLEGKLRFLSDRIAMTTVTISAREDRHYLPAQAPTFLARAGSTFAESIEAMRLVAEALALAAIAVSPWAAVACVLLSPGVVYWRLRRRRH
jgi:hypothetical protein